MMHESSCSTLYNYIVKSLSVYQNGISIQKIGMIASDLELQAKASSFFNLSKKKSITL